MAYKRDIRTIVKQTPRGPRRVRVAMGAYSDLAQKQCGSDQRFDPSFVFPGLPPGQCVNQDQYNTYHANDTASSGSSSGAGFFSDLAAGLASVFKPGAPAAAPVIMPSSGGIGTGTALAIGGGALLLVVLLTRK